MKTICVLQHTEAEFLGLMEDHLEGRSIRFQYVRPFTPGATVPATADGFDGLVVLGAGPKGIVSGDLVPSLGPELRLARDFLARGLPVIGIGFGACLLAAAAGGGADEVPLRFTVGTASRLAPQALDGHLPESYPLVVYMRDRPVLPAGAQVLAVDDAGAPALFQIRGNCLGFLGHPGIKSAMIEDLIMEFEEAPADTAETLARLRSVQGEIATALSEIMIGIVKTAHLMDPLP
jgi:GMP synthase (glutamine-hydrolysing)